MSRFEPVFVGQDPKSSDEHCPAVFIDPNTGDFLFQGRIITNPAILEMIAKHGAIASDEAVVWLPARMRQLILDALNGFEGNRLGHGSPTLAEMLATAKRSAVHLEMRDLYGPEPGYDDWLAGGDGRTDRSRWIGLVSDAVKRGVKMRRARIVSEPVSDYIRWEHMVTDVNVKAGEEVRWLPRKKASGIMLPHSDFWMFDQSLVAFNFNGGDSNHVPGYEYVSDPRYVTQIVGAFEMVWERATPHEEFHL
ncbi:DUF6879 family protein [Streptosporangium saharense]|uniref:DUF6879 family protein n=1 Tax=Streptosporangium saharense TaxID=1706840 RepID=UPI0036B1EE43